MEFYLSQIIYWACNFAPRSWAFCAGALLPISSNTALFSLIGTAFGGDGRTTFGLPDLRGRTPVGMGHGPGLSNYNMGQGGGTEVVTLNMLQIPSHNHILDTSQLNVNIGIQANSGQADTHAPSNGASLAAPYDPNNLAEVLGFNSTAPDVTLLGGTGAITGSGTVTNTGGSQFHENRSPFLTLNPCICMQGLFPSRS
ncbi:phage tail protein [uncultured Aquimarina sp.]|uniref:phage tail protein n=1 Tax=uncultured Aquimarina sp. TaxID=575652 RepID=UPI002615A4B9|nr:tail fiber protein [uncultured Aquimarina sp.]